MHHTPTPYAPARLAAAALAALLCAACETPSREDASAQVVDPAIPIPAAGLVLDVPGASVWLPGERREVVLWSQRIDGVATPHAAARVRWRVEGDAARVDAQGRVVAVRAGQAEVIASMVGAPEDTARAVVIVREGQAEGVVITPAQHTARVGEALDLYPEVLWSDGARVDGRSAVTWQVEGDAVRVDEIGRLVAVRSGAARVWAEALGQLASAEVRVIEGAPVRLDVWPCAQRVPVGARVQAQGVLRFATGGSAEPRDRVVWRSSNPAVAQVDANGLVEVLAPGTAVIVGEVDGLSGQTTIEGRALRPALSFLPGEVWLAPGQLATVKVRAALAATEGRVGDVLEVGRGCAWSVDDPSVARVALAPERAGTIAAVRPGLTILHARCGGEHLYMPIVVSDADAQALSVEPPTLRVPLGATFPLEALATFAQSPRLATAQATWTSDDPTIIEASNHPSWRGFITAHAPGVATITATLGGQRASLTVEVADVALQRIDLTPEDADLRVGERSQYSATGHYSDGSSFYISRLTEWTSDQPALGRLDASRVGRGTLCALAPGALTVTASLDGAQGQTTAQIGGVVEALELSGPQALLVGDHAQLVATMRLRDGARHNVTGRAQWAALDDTIVVDAQGVVRALGAGPARVRATLGGAQATLTITARSR